MSDTEFYHWFIEIQKLAYAQRTRLGDIDFLPQSFSIAQNMTNTSFIKWLLNKVPKKAQPYTYYSNDETYHVKCFNFVFNQVYLFSKINLKQLI